MIVRIFRLEENKINSHVIKEIKNKLILDKKVNISEADIESLSQEIILTSQNSYIEIADIIKEYLEVTPQKRFGLARTIQRVINEYSNKKGIN